jgi:hypothetical protein
MRPAPTMPNCAPGLSHCLGRMQRPRHLRAEDSVLGPRLKNGPCYLSLFPLHAGFRTGLLLRPRCVSALDPRESPPLAAAAVLRGSPDGTGLHCHLHKHHHHQNQHAQASTPPTAQPSTARPGSRASRAAQTSGARGPRARRRPRPARSAAPATRAPAPWGTATPPRWTTASPCRATAGLPATGRTPAPRASSEERGRGPVC